MGISGDRKFSRLALVLVTGAFLALGCRSQGSDGAALRIADDGHGPDVAPEEPALDPSSPSGPAPAPAPVPPPPGPTYAHEWHVSPSGSDIAAGSQAKPFRSIGKGIAAAGPGDIIHVAAGTYSECLSIGPGDASGTASARILLKGEGKPRVLLQCAFTVQRPYWTIDGFNLDAQNRPQFAVER